MNEEQQTAMRTILAMHEAVLTGRPAEGSVIARTSGITYEDLLATAMGMLVRVHVELCQERNVDPLKHVRSMLAMSELDSTVDGLPHDEDDGA